MHTATTSAVPATAEQWARYNPMKSGSRPGFIHIDGVDYPHERTVYPAFQPCGACGRKLPAGHSENAERGMVECCCGLIVTARTEKAAVARYNALTGYEAKIWFDKLEIFDPAALLFWQLLNSKPVPSIKEAATILTIAEMRLGAQTKLGA